MGSKLKYLGLNGPLMDFESSYRIFRELPPERARSHSVIFLPNINVHVRRLYVHTVQLMLLYAMPV